MVWFFQMQRGVYAKQIFMKGPFFFLLGSILLVCISGVYHANKKPDTIYFTSLYKVVELGQYDGVSSVKDLLTHGNFGLGSEEKLLSELIVLDGVPYSVRADGNVRVLSGDMFIPFAAVKFFNADTSLQIHHEMTFKKLKTLLDSIVGENSFAGVRITANFTSIEYRSFYKQGKPYKPQKEALSNRFIKKESQGTLVGFFTPSLVAEIRNPGSCFHWLSADKTTGGHVLDLTLTDAKLEIDFSRELSVQLPDKRSMADIKFEQKGL
jgi:acetolactate decarboxylase